jgi:hypothetical protein
MSCSSAQAEQAAPPRQLRGRRMRVNFSDGDRERHLQVLSEWLPADLRQLSFVDWTPLPSKVIACLINGMEPEIWLGHLALAFLSATPAMRILTLRNHAQHLHTLLRKVCQVVGIARPEELTKSTWETFAAQTEITPGIYKALKWYRTLTEKHLPDYLDQLEQQQRLLLQSYLLPPLPRRFWETYIDPTAVDMASQVRRKEKSDILEPLHPFLVALIRFRKQAAERMVLAFRKALAEGRSMGQALPFAFQYEEELVFLNQDAQTVAELRLEKRQVTLSFRIWDYTTWILAHPENYQASAKSKARTRLKLQQGGAHAEVFVEFLSPVEDLLWFGDLVKYRALQKPPWNMSGEQKREREVLMGKLPTGCATRFTLT